MLTSASLPKFHTKLLLKALRSSCVSKEQTDELLEFRNEERILLGYAPHPDNTADFIARESHYVYASAFGYDDSLCCNITVAQLKEELAKRPHVPNKQEAKVIRKEKMKRNKNKGRKDR